MSLMLDFSLSLLIEYDVSIYLEAHQFSVKQKFEMFDLQIAQR